jgi:integrase/recombinase XerD
MKQAPTFTADELASVLEAADVQERAMVLLSFKCGLRAMELAALEWRDVRSASGGIAEHVDIAPSQTKGKLGAGRVPMTQALRDALAALYEARRRPSVGRVLIGADHAPLSSTAVQKRYRALLHRAGMAGSSHSGRRTFGTALAAHVNLPTLALALRHRDLSSSLHYMDAASDATLSAAIKSL